jgi:hypothetical protein
MVRRSIAAAVLAVFAACGEPAREEQTGPSGQVVVAADSGETGNTEEGLIDGRDAGVRGERG